MAIWYSPDLSIGNSLSFIIALYHAKQFNQYVVLCGRKNWALHKWYATESPAQETKIGVAELKYEISKLEISSS
jgi:hypothetical protein